jgi:hypothetical protein
LQPQLDPEKPPLLLVDDEVKRQVS